MTYILPFQMPAFAVIPNAATHHEQTQLSIAGMFALCKSTLTDTGLSSIFILVTNPVL